MGNFSCHLQWHDIFSGFEKGTILELHQRRDHIEIAKKYIESIELNFISSNVAGIVVSWEKLDSKNEGVNKKPLFSNICIQNLYAFIIGFCLFVSAFIKGDLLYSIIGGSLLGLYLYLTTYKNDKK